MTVQFYRNRDINLDKNENFQTKRVVRRLLDYYGPRNDQTYFIIDFYDQKTNQQFDIIGLCENLIFSIDLKNYSGKITGDYETKWEYHDGDRCGEIYGNPKKQASIHRKFLNEMLFKNGSNLSGMKWVAEKKRVNSLICFKEKSTYESELSLGDLWLTVTSEDRLIQDIESLKKENNISIPSEEIKIFIEYLNLTQIDDLDSFDKYRSKPDNHSLSDFIERINRRGLDSILDGTRSSTGTGLNDAMIKILIEDGIIIKNGTDYRMTDRIRRIGYPYKVYHKSFYKGFEVETEEIYRQIMKNRVSYLSGLKGEGKTSFVNASLYHRIIEGNNIAVIIDPDDFCHYKDVVNKELRKDVPINFDNYHFFQTVINELSLGSKLIVCLAGFDDALHNPDGAIHNDFLNLVVDTYRIPSIHYLVIQDKFKDSDKLFENWFIKASNLYGEKNNGNTIDRPQYIPFDCGNSLKKILQAECQFLGFKYKQINPIMKSFETFLSGSDRYHLTFLQIVLDYLSNSKDYECETENIITEFYIQKLGSLGYLKTSNLKRKLVRRLLEMPKVGFPKDELVLSYGECQRHYIDDSLCELESFAFVSREFIGGSERIMLIPYMIRERIMEQLFPADSGHFDIYDIVESQYKLWVNINSKDNPLTKNNRALFNLKNVNHNRLEKESGLLEKSILEQIFLIPEPEFNENVWTFIWSSVEQIDEDYVEQDCDFRCLNDRYIFRSGIASKFKERGFHALLNFLKTTCSGEEPIVFDVVQDVMYRSNKKDIENFIISIFKEVNSFKPAVLNGILKLDVINNSFTGKIDSESLLDIFKRQEFPDATKIVLVDYISDRIADRLPSIIDDTEVTPSVKMKLLERLSECTYVPDSDRILKYFDESFWMDFYNAPRFQKLPLLRIRIHHDARKYVHGTIDLFAHYLNESLIEKIIDELGDSYRDQIIKIKLLACLGRDRDPLAIFQIIQDFKWKSLLLDGFDTIMNNSTDVIKTSIEDFVNQVEWMDTESNSGISSVHIRNQIIDGIIEEINGLFTRGSISNWEKHDVIGYLDTLRQGDASDLFSAALQSFVKIGGDKSTGYILSLVENARAGEFGIDIKVIDILQESFRDLQADSHSLTPAKIITIMESFVGEVDFYRLLKIFSFILREDRDLGIDIARSILEGEDDHMNALRSTLLYHFSEVEFWNDIFLDTIPKEATVRLLSYHEYYDGELFFNIDWTIFYSLVFPILRKNPDDYRFELIDSIRFSIDEFDDILKILLSPENDMLVEKIGSKIIGGIDRMDINTCLDKLISNDKAQSHIIAYLIGKTIDRTWDKSIIIRKQEYTKYLLRYSNEFSGILAGIELLSREWGTSDFLVSDLVIPNPDYDTTVVDSEFLESLLIDEQIKMNTKRFHRDFLDFYHPLLIEFLDKNDGKKTIMNYLITESTGYLLDDKYAMLYLQTMKSFNLGDYNDLVAVHRKLDLNYKLIIIDKLFDLNPLKTARALLGKIIIEEFLRIERDSPITLIDIDSDSVNQKEALSLIKGIVDEDSYDFVMDLLQIYDETDSKGMGSIFQDFLRKPNRNKYFVDKISSLMRVDSVFREMISLDIVRLSHNIWNIGDSTIGTGFRKIIALLENESQLEWIEHDYVLMG